MNDLKTKHAKLTAEWKKRDLKACSATLDDLKVSMAATMADFLVGGEEEEASSSAMLARNVLEIGAQHAIAVRDVVAFERFMAQLKTYYERDASSAYRFELLGLNLMCLLAQNRIADFHAELERLPHETLTSNAYIRCPVRLEQFIMEGSYNKVLMMKDNVPAESYAFFIDMLLRTIRDEIASCVEKAYESVSVKECAKMLQLEPKAAAKFIAARKGWSVGKDQVIRFEDVEGAENHKINEEVPTEELAKMAITYAREMEQIV